MSYLLKNVSAETWPPRSAPRTPGAPTLAPEAAQELIRAAAAPLAPGHDLTTRERDVLRCW